MKPVVVVVGLLIVLFGLAVTVGAVPLSVVSYSVTVTGITVSCSNGSGTQWPYACSSTFTVNNPNVGNNPFTVDFKVFAYAPFQGSASSGHWVQQWDATYSLNVPAGSSAQSTFSNFGADSDSIPYYVQVTVFDSHNSQVSSASTFYFTATGTLPLTVAQGVDYVTGGLVAGCPTTPSQGTVLEAYQSTVTVKAPSCSGFTFENWSFRSSATGLVPLTYSTSTLAFTMNYATTVTPEYAASTGNGGGGGCPTCITVAPERTDLNSVVSPSSPQALEPGDSVTFTFSAGGTQTSLTGWSGWTLFGGPTQATSGTSATLTLTYSQLQAYGLGNFFSLVSGPFSVSATYTGSATVQSDLGWGVVATPTSATLESGGSATITLSASPGYVLPSAGVAWDLLSTSISGTGTTVTLTYAQLKPFFSAVGCNPGIGCTFYLHTDSLANALLTIGGSPGGTTTPAAGSYTQYAGQTVTVTAAPSPGYCLGSWLEDGHAKPNATSISVQMNASHEISPEWSPLTQGVCNPLGASPAISIFAFYYGPTLTFTTNPPTGYYVETPGKVVSVSLTVTPGYTFCYWSENGVPAGSANPLSITVPSYGTIFVTAFAVPNGYSCGGPGEGGGGSPTSISGPNLDGILIIAGGGIVTFLGYSLEPGGMSGTGEVRPGKRS